MASGPDRRTFLRGAAGAAGLGAVGALSTRVPYAAASVPLGRPADVVIDVTLVPVSGSTTRKRIVCADTEARAGDFIEWEATTTNIEIFQIIFKGRSPFRRGPDDLEVLEGPGALGTAPNLKQRVFPGAEEGRYSYTILVKDTSTNRVYAKDPDLDII